MYTGAGKFLGPFCVYTVQYCVHGRGKILETFLNGADSLNGAEKISTGKICKKMHLVLGYFLSSGQNSRFWVVFCLQDKTVVFEVFFVVRTVLTVILGDFFENLSFFGVCPKNFVKKKVETFFFVFV